MFLYMLVEDMKGNLKLINSGCLYQWESRDSSVTRIFF